MRQVPRASLARPWLAVLATVIATVTACGGDTTSPEQPLSLHAPELRYLGRETYGSGVPDALRLELTNFGEYAYELFAEAPELPPCGQNERAARTWIRLFADGTLNYGYCAGVPAPPLPDTRRLAVFRDPSDPMPSVVTVELWDRATDRRVSADIAIDPDLRYP